jgi:hypothetical protein
MTDDTTKPPIPPSISKYLSKIGRRGGIKGGAKTGLCKARSADHYKLMVEKRIAANRARKAAKLEAERLAAETAAASSNEEIS